MSKKQAQKQASHVPHKVNRNALSACGSGNLLSDAAIAAQARADAVKEPAKKRQRRAPTPPDSTPVAALPVCGSSDLSSGSREAWRFKTKEDAIQFLNAHDIMPYEETNGDIVGYDASDKRYGGEGDPPLPPHIVEAFYVLNDGPEAVYVHGAGQWQIVGKGGAKAK